MHMSTSGFIKVCAAVVVAGFCTYLVGVMYTKYTQSSRLERESVAVEQFHAKENLYSKLLNSWTEIVPAKCGNASATPGVVASESLSREHDGKFSVTTNDASYSDVSIDELAKQLDAKPEIVRSALDELDLVGSPEIIQSGAEVKVISPENNTHGYLHVDQSCAEAATIAFWSEQRGNFTADNPGHYIGLKSLGGGWYYYVEQR